MKIVLWITLLLATCALAAADVTGKWSGTFEAAGPDGNTKSETAFLVLKQDGATLTGTAGPNEEHQLPLRNGKVDGNKLTFEVPLGENGERVIKFELTADGDQINGNMTVPTQEGSNVTAKLSVKRIAG